MHLQSLYVNSISSRNFVDYATSKPPSGKRLTPIDQQKLAKKSTPQQNSTENRERASSGGSANQRKVDKGKIFILTISSLPCY